MKINRRDIKYLLLKCRELRIVQNDLYAVRVHAASCCNIRARVYPRPIALCNEIRIRSPANPCFTRRVSHALFLLTVHVDVTTIQYRNASHTAAKRCSPGNRLCVCDYIIVEDKCRYRAHEVKMFPRLITAGFSP